GRHRSPVDHRHPAAPLLRRERGTSGTGIGELPRGRLPTGAAPAGPPRAAAARRPGRLGAVRRDRPHHGADRPRRPDQPTAPAPPRCRAGRRVAGAAARHPGRARRRRPGGSGRVDAAMRRRRPPAPRPADRRPAVAGRRQRTGTGRVRVGLPVSGRRRRGPDRGRGADAAAAAGRLPPARRLGGDRPVLALPATGPRAAAGAGAGARGRLRRGPRPAPGRAPPIGACRVAAARPQSLPRRHGSAARRPTRDL
ncbi:MAG: hypothetical protein AVDCRST_MAG57-2603, partial [uncultured Blastococcus sp.]